MCSKCLSKHLIQDQLDNFMDKNEVKLAVTIAHHTATTYKLKSQNNVTFQIKFKSTYDTSKLIKPQNAPCFIHLSPIGDWSLPRALYRNCNVIFSRQEVAAQGKIAAPEMDKPGGFY